MHYAIQLFEGMKAYRRPDGKVQMFRPDKNMERMHNSAERSSLPLFDKVSSTAPPRVPPINVACLGGDVEVHHCVG